MFHARIVYDYATLCCYPFVSYLDQNSGVTRAANHSSWAKHALTSFTSGLFAFCIYVFSEPITAVLKSSHPKIFSEQSLEKLFSIFKRLPRSSVWLSQRLINKYPMRFPLTIKITQKGSKEVIWLNGNNGMSRRKQISFKFISSL